MRTLTFIAVVAGLIAVGGCASRRTLASRVAVPLPQTTPYDTNATTRATFLSHYAEGYRDGIAGRAVYPYYPPGQAPVIERHGYVAGNAAGWQVLFDRSRTPKTNDLR